MPLSFLHFHPFPSIHQPLLVIYHWISPSKIPNITSSNRSIRGGHCYSGTLWQPGNIMHNCCNLSLILLTNSIQSWACGPSSIPMISELPLFQRYQPCHMFQVNELDTSDLMKEGWVMIWAVIHNRFDIYQTVYSHAQSVALLDIKPQNILINRKKCKAVFCNFGISVEAASKHVSNGGTPYYIPQK